MVYTYTLTYQDFLAAQRLHVRVNPRTRLAFLICNRILPVLGIPSLCVLLADLAFHRVRLQPMQGFVLGIIAWLGMFFLITRPISLRRAYRAILPELGKAGRPVELEIREGQLISRVPGRSEGRFLPAAVLRIEEDARVGLVYVGPKRFLFLPKHALPAEAWAAVRVWQAQRDPHAD